MACYRKVSCKTKTSLSHFSSHTVMTPKCLDWTGGYRCWTHRFVEYVVNRSDIEQYDIWPLSTPERKIKAKGEANTTFKSVL